MADIYMTRPIPHHKILLLLHEHFPHLVKVKENYSYHAEPDYWCRDNIGPIGRTTEHGDDDGRVSSVTVHTDALWCRTNGIYGFKNPNHAVAFKMVFG